MLSPKRLKIVVAIDTSPFSVAVLDEAAVCAKLFDADVNVVLIEDENMLNAAKSPLVRSVNLFSFSNEAISSNEVEDIFALQRKTASKTIKYAEDKHDIKIALEIRRGKVVDEILAASKNADALMIGLAGWRFAKYYYSTHMLKKQSRFKFPTDGEVTLGAVAKKLLKKHKGTILALRGNIFKKAKIMTYYDGSDIAKKALINTLDYLSRLKRRTSIGLDILLSDKNLRNEAFLAISEKNKDITPNFHPINDSHGQELIDFTKKLIDNTKSNILTLPGSCDIVDDEKFYAEISSLGVSVIIIR